MGLGQWLCHPTRDNYDYIHHHAPTGHDHRAASDDNRAFCNDHNYPNALTGKGWAILPSPIHFSFRNIRAFSSVG